MLAKTYLLLGLALGAGAVSAQAQAPVPGGGSAQDAKRFDRSPRQIRSLIQEHMVRRPYAAIERSLLLRGNELDRVREVLQLHASTTFQRHLAAEREGKPGLAAMIGQQIEADQKKRQAIAAGLLEASEEEGLEGFDYLPITVIDELVQVLPAARSKQFLQQLGTDKRIQLSRLGKRRAMAFKLALPKMRAGLASARAAKAFFKREGFQTYGAAPDRSSSLFGGRGGRGRRGGQAGAGFGGAGGGGAGAQGAGRRGGRGNGIF